MSDSRNRPTMTPFAAAAAIRRDLEAAGHEAWLVGGAVRDVKLGMAPDALREVDVASSATPDEVEALFRRTIPVGKAFGVIQVGRRNQWVEVATFREDADYGDGRRPDAVTFSDAEADVRRRDFTINGLLWNPDTDEVRDHVEGLADLERGLVRAIGDPTERFGEDHLRMLRAIRFGSSRSFRLEAETEAAVTAGIANLATVSAERVHEELAKIARRKESRPGDAWRALVRTGAAEVVLPDAARSLDVDADADVLDRLHDAYGGSLPLFLAVVHRRALSAGTPPAAWQELGEATISRLRGSKEEMRQLGQLLRGRHRYRAWSRMSLARRRIAATREDHELHEALLAAEGDAAEILSALADVRSGFAARPEPLLDGRALMKAGIPPGPRLGFTLRRIRLWQLSGEVATPTEALAKLQS